MAYIPDGACLLVGGHSKYVVLYDVREGEDVMIKTIPDFGEPFARWD